MTNYRIIGQLSSLAILHLGRSPQCFHLSVINYKFYSQVDNDPQLVDHGEFMDNICRIESQYKSKNLLLYKQHFMMISRSAGIEQFKQVLLSISSQFYKSGCCLEKYLVEHQKCLTYHDVWSQIVFHKTAEEESNAAFCQENAIIEFELYLMSLKCFLEKLFAICHSNWPDTSLGIRQKNWSVFDRPKFVASFFDMRFNTLLTAKDYKKYVWNSFNTRVKFWYNLNWSFYWYNKTLHLRLCTLGIVNCQISLFFCLFFFFLSFFFEGITS